MKIKKNNPDLMALKGEALSMLGRYREAVEAFDFALAANPKAAEVLNARAIARAAQGRIREANADWQEQLRQLGAGQNEARAYVALRLADYETALPEIERALAKVPNDPYWRLYRLAALRRLGGHPGPIDVPSGGDWPIPLIALHAGELDAEEVLKVIQRFDPIGVCARDVRECLLVQAALLYEKDHLVVKLIEKHLEDLEKRNVAAITKATASATSSASVLARCGSRSIHSGRARAVRAIPCRVLVLPWYVTSNAVICFSWSHLLMSRSASLTLSR